ncbi:MAG TPA: hypothetical protein VN885_02510 [Candidatus Acidoferrales bacterium]|nr:hypothetical protein [Candidatus Acidoferrales bacterium]
MNSRLRNVVLPAFALIAADAPQLKLKWAPGTPSVRIIRSQPGEYRSPIFVSGNGGALYTLDALTARTCCTASTFPGFIPPVLGTTRFVTFQVNRGGR